ncbi:ABC-type multidrug transport system, ATPase and permease component [Gottschalkia purinilytica]|uniref:ABC-type multidrug transport system, ATPase and permease component n=1 Tax=Gottschalkia purinilytica TaxID=1503 RepID=A0A0L0WDE8_GOTPU|nr:ABC transporter transmembrane domain-containing protein [Gottschalkia purinilytica]KNF09504.1 ABC-type multidrug transport system, ATPase and permease component [Gottschalkia purinilytica]
MQTKNPLEKDKHFYWGIVLTVLEGLLSGGNFMLLWVVMQELYSGSIDVGRIFSITGILAGIFVLRLIIYSTGYVQAQIGGAEVSKNVRLFLGDKIKKIPLCRFTQGQTGEYINTVTSDVNNYEKILTHKVGDLAKNISLSVMLIIFVATIWLPAGIILLVADLLLVPALWFSFRAVKKYGNQKAAICAENVSSIVEYVSGIQTFRAYGIGGTKNKTVTKAMKDFSDISFLYEAKVLPIGAVLGILI